MIVNQCEAREGLWTGHSGFGPVQNPFGDNLSPNRWSGSSPPLNLGLDHRQVRTTVPN